MFVEGSARIAKFFGISEFLIGLTLIAGGTSIPELSSSIIASLDNQSGLITGTIIGSNIANIGLIVGLSALFMEIKIDKGILKRDCYIMLFTAILFYVFILDGRLSKGEGFFFILLYFAYIKFLLAFSSNKRKQNFKEFLKYFVRMEYIIPEKSQSIIEIAKKMPKITSGYIYKLYRTAIKHNLIRDSVVIIASILAIIFGAKSLVGEAVWFANYFQIPPNIIGLTVIAVGTSLPELMVSLSSARKGYSKILLGNILGSNIINILLILGVSSLINPINILKTTLLYNAPFMIFFSFLFMVIIRRYWRIKRTEGAILLLLYISFIVFQIFATKFALL